MNLRLLSLVLATFASTPALAINVNISGFFYRSPPSVVFDNDLTDFGYDGEAGAFKGTLSDATTSARTALVASTARVALAASTTSFVAYCAEITQTVFAGVNYQYDIANSQTYFTPQKLTDLSRLFTATAGFVDNSSTSAAVQAGIWEIIYEPGETYSLTGGHVTIAPQLPADQAAFDAVNSDLAHLSSYDAGFHIEVLTNPQSQDLIIATPVPEPGIWALMAGGLGAIGFLARRRSR